MEKGDRRVIVIGKAGIGKSALCNSLLGTELFESRSSLEAVTEDCAFGWAVREGRKIYVYDTPGALSEEIEEKAVAESIGRCMMATAPGFHCILLTFEASRFRREERELLEFLENVLGADMYKYAIAVFTKIDNLDKNQSFEDFLYKNPEKKNKTLKRLLEKCKDRIIGVNNKLEGEKNDEQFNRVMSMINRVFEENNNQYYSHELYPKAMELLQKEKEKIMKDNPEMKDSEADEIARKEAFDGKVEGWEGLAGIIMSWLRKVFKKDEEGGCFFL